MPILDWPSCTGSTGSQALLGNEGREREKRGSTPFSTYGEGSQTRCFCSVDDLSEGFVRLMNSLDELAGPLNLGNPVEFTMIELAERAWEPVGGKRGSPARARSHALRGSVAPTLRVARPEQSPRRLAGSAMSVAGTRSVPKRLPRRAWEPVGGKRGSQLGGKRALRGSVAPTLRVARPEQAARRMAGSAVSVAGTRSVPKRLPRRAWEPVGGERGSVAPTLRVARPEQAPRRMAGSAVSVAGTRSVPKRLPRRAWEPVGGGAWERVGGEAWEPSASSLPRSAWECRRDAPRRVAGAGGSAHGGIRGVGGRDAERPEAAPTQSVGASWGEAWEPVGGEAWEPSASSLPRSAWECRRDAPRREAGAGASAHGGIRGVGGRDAERPEAAPTQSVGASWGGAWEPVGGERGSQLGGKRGSPARARSHALRGSVAPTLRVARPEQAPRRMAGSAVSVAGTRSVPKRLPRRAWEPVGGERGSPARARSHALRGSVAATLRVARPEQAPRRMAGSAMSVAGTRSVPKRLPRRAWEPVGGEAWERVGGEAWEPVGGKRYLGDLGIDVVRCDETTGHDAADLDRWLAS
ncbi:hypothetical protein BDD21_2685 [Thiocapsa rosea]|uniref:Uncharacterized protein n=1 Tax=Thiocapsa rosea TaxID=69360 RepID=A0A495V9F5_9GAMM|nr:hypothetical protein BDD21_2685 [Thiocapsa rosea]